MKKKVIVFTVIFLWLAAILYAISMISGSYILSSPLMTVAGGTAQSASFIVNSAIGQSAQGNASSASYQSQIGSNQIQTATVSLPPASTDLSQVYAFPNPFKPGTGGQFDASYITFNKLTDQVTIKIYNYSGVCVATLNKTDRSVDYYQWNTTNDSGEKLASGVYIYLIKNTAGQSAKGKFSIIR
jgi:hypothetical protein